MLLELIVGCALGAASSVPPGPCNVAVLTAAVRHSRRRAIATGAGSALGDVIYATAGVVGLGPLVTRSAAVVLVLQLVGGALLIACGLRNLRARPADLGAVHGTCGARPGHRRRGFATGLGLVIANPASLIAWVVIVGAVFGARAGGAWAVVGIGLGSLAGYTLLAHLAWGGQRARGARMGRVVAVASGLLIVSGVVALARVGIALVAHAC